jgi:hypothetical protein
VQAIGFLHPVAGGRVTLSAHGCVAHSWTRRIGPSRAASATDLARKISAHFQGEFLEATPDRKVSAPAHLLGYNSLPRVSVCDLPCCPRLCLQLPSISGPTCLLVLVCFFCVSTV